MLAGHGQSAIWTSADLIDRMSFFTVIDEIIDDDPHAILMSLYLSSREQGKVCCSFLDGHGRVELQRPRPPDLHGAISAHTQM